MRNWMAVTAAAAAAFGAGAAWGNAVPRDAATARVAAQRILRDFVPPPGATESSVDPSASRLGRPAVSQVTPNLVDVHRFWHVPGDPPSVYDWISAHPPAGSRLSGRGSEGASGTIDSQWAVFNFVAPGRGGAPLEALVVNVVAARGGGAAIRADGQVVWRLKRPATERIPAGARSLLVSEAGVNGRPSGRWKVGDERRVRQAASLIDRLPAAQPGAVACPADRGPYVTLVFATRSGKRIASAVVDGSGCLGVNLSIRGHREPPLQGDPNLIARLSSALGISL